MAWFYESQPVTATQEEKRQARIDLLAQMEADLADPETPKAMRPRIMFDIDHLLSLDGKPAKYHVGL